ncbi:hypothetical protein AZE42_10312 [Rhizopogon vesiculosus]|uniref:Uncharacterized protein n=1 Tax=Rhizopogon vesiculosus TaxID=180088 RepID=A0A1J8Q1K6_9AGAM|nr:hypothetical protein AZE42_10312 [Rhizopogon vesiculosus]
MHGLVSLWRVNVFGVAILTYTGKRIIDNVLKAHLVDPLPCDAKLFALWDCSHSHTMLDLEHYNCNAWRVPSKVQSGLAKKIKSLGKRLNTSLVRDSSQGRRSSTKEDCQARTRSSKINSMHLPDLYRVSSPDSYLARCTPDCPMTLPEMQVKAHIVSLSACRDNELAYDDNATGETVTKFFIEHLERNPNTTYRDLLSFIQQRVDAITCGRTRAKKSTSDYPHHLQKLSENEVEIENWHKCERHDHSNDENDTSILNSQQPSYSSHYRLDMSQVVDI